MFKQLPLANLPATLSEPHVHWMEDDGRQLQGLALAVSQRRIT
jgi:hypothetical protein